MAERESGGEKGCAVKFVDMEIRTYPEIYEDFKIALLQTQIVSIVVFEGVKEFPDALPHGVGERLAAELQRMTRVLAAERKAAERANIEMPEVSLGQVDETATHILIFLQSIRSRYGKDSPEAKYPFKGAAHSQEMVMLLAHLDAFMADTLKAICRKQPNVLKQSKHITWKDAMSLGSWDALVEHLTEITAYEFGFGPLSERILTLSNRLGVKVDIPSELASAIHCTEQIRHLIVHNGGRVSAEYIKNVKDETSIIGEVVPINDERIKAARTSVSKFGSLVFQAVKKKYFDEAECP